MAEKTKGSAPTVPVPTGPPPQTEFDAMINRSLDQMVVEGPGVAPEYSQPAPYQPPTQNVPVPTDQFGRIMNPVRPMSAEDAAQAQYQAMLRQEESLMASRPKPRFAPLPDLPHPAATMAGPVSGTGGLVMVREGADPELIDAYRCLSAIRARGLIITQNTFNEVDTLLARIAAKISVPSGGTKPGDPPKGT